MTRTKLLAAVALVGALAMTAATPGYARDGRNAAAAIGFGAGALVGAAAANAANNNAYYNGGYYEPGYAYDPGYVAEEPGYAYESDAVVSYGPRRGYGGQCWISTDSNRGYGYYGACP